MQNKQRINIIYFSFLFLFSLIFLKIFYLQVLKRGFFQHLAQGQHYRLMPLEGKRGLILDCKKRILANDINCYSIFADPSAVDQKEQTAQIISSNLNLEKDEILSKLQKKKKFVWIKRKISWEDKEKIKSLKLKGIGFLRETKRFYLQDNLASSLLGIVDIDNKGLEGLELFYNSYLRGKGGFVKILQDSSSREIMFSPKIIVPQAGADLVLNLDSQIQYWVQEYLEEAIKTYQAKAGSVIVMDSENGGILALANYPTFYPNDSTTLSPTLMRNRAISDIFEPGSVFKVVTLIVAVNEGNFSDDDKIFCENGKLKIPGTVLNDWKPYGELTFKEVFMKSSNIGVAKVARSFDFRLFHNYMKKLGFGDLTGIDLPGETKGLLKSPSDWSKTSQYIIPIGQEVGVNLVQLVRVFAAVANGGYLVTPRVAKSICSRGFCRDISTIRRRILPQATAERAKTILIDVVESGTGKLAAVKERKIGGKTGTAQKYDPEIKRYSSSKYRATFVGFVADLDPPLVIAITIDEPKKSHFGGVVAAPVFGKIAQKVIKYQEAD